MTRQSRELSRGGLETKIKVDRRNGLDRRCLRNEPALRLRPQVLARIDVIFFYFNKTSLLSPFFKQSWFIERRLSAV